MKNLNLFVACHLMVSLAACSSTGVTYYADQLPKLVLEDFFDGNLEAYGVVKDWRGRVIRRFDADIITYWDRCVWTLNPLDQGRYSGIADDLVGEGDVAVEGNSAFFDYILRIPYNEGTLDVKIDDRMYLVTPDVLINESRMSKFGIPVGEFLLVIEKIKS